jgi:electron transfer flavoprotein beta subunit
LKTLIVTTDVFAWTLTQAGPIVGTEAVVKIVVTLKQVPDPNVPPSHLTVDEVARKVVPPANTPPVMNGYDANALEEAIRLKEQHGGVVNVVSLGDDSARDTLKRAIAMGADTVLLVNDPDCLDGDSFTTARVLASAVRSLGDFDLILSGRQASDTDAGQVLHGIAEFLGLPSVAPIKRIECVEPGAVIVHRIIEDGYQRLRVRTPALLGVSSEINEPRYPPPRGLMAAARTHIPARPAASVGAPAVTPKLELRHLQAKKGARRAELIAADSGAELGIRLADRLREMGLI